MNITYFQKRIVWQGDIKILLLKICKDYKIGSYSEHEIILVGYEDFNLILMTEQEKYFVKIFANFRDLENCQRYVEIMTKVIEAGVKHPALYKSPQGNLYKTEIDGVSIHLCVMQYINGKSFYDLNKKTRLTDVSFFAEQAALINQINLKPAKVYDTWAIVNFLEEFTKKKQYLDLESKRLIEPLSKKFNSLDIANLPHCFVHGDIIKTNVLSNSTGNLYILDFSVANYYPRIQELAVLFCNVLFDEDNLNSFTDFYNLSLAQYQKHILLTPAEIAAMPIYVQAAHAMHIICPTYEKIVSGNNTPENDYWLKLGKIGLRYTSKLWQTE